jgi:hypothetical protein
MIAGETYLLEAVREVLRIKLALPETACDCEYDEQIPAIANDMYYAIINNGIEPGRTNGTAGGVCDVVHSVQVLVLNRKLEARDKRRNLFMQRLVGLNAALDNVFLAIHRQVEITTLANALMFEDDPAAAPFQNTLFYANVDRRPKMVNSQTYGGKAVGGPGTTDGIAMARSIYFTGIRRMQTVVQVHTGYKVT